MEWNESNNGIDVWIGIMESNRMNGMEWNDYGIEWNRIE